MIDARRSYYSQFMEENSSNQSQLFWASNNLLNIQADKTLPPHTDAESDSATALEMTTDPSGVTD